MNRIKVRKCYFTHHRDQRNAPPLSNFFYELVPPNKDHLRLPVYILAVTFHVLKTYSKLTLHFDYIQLASYSYVIRVNGGIKPCGKTRHRRREVALYCLALNILVNANKGSAKCVKHALCCKIVYWKASVFKNFVLKTILFQCFLWKHYYSSVSKNHWLTAGLC